MLSLTYRRHAHIAASSNGQDRLELRAEPVDVGHGEHQGRTDFQHTSVMSAYRDKHMPLAHRVDEFACAGPVRSLGVGVADDLDTHVQPGTAHLTNPRVVFGYPC